MSNWVSTATSGHLRGRRSKNTEPELIIRKALHASGFRFRLHRKIAPGCNPDLVLPRFRIALFVDGDFWHGCPRHDQTSKVRGPNAQLWRDKIQRNRERDARATQIAEEAGWHVIRVWECDVRTDLKSVLATITDAAKRT